MKIIRENCSCNGESLPSSNSQLGDPFYFRRLMWKREFDTSYVGFMKDGARWLVENTDIKLVGERKITLLLTLISFRRAQWFNWSLLQLCRNWLLISCSLWWSYSISSRISRGQGKEIFSGVVENVFYAWIFSGLSSFWLFNSSFFFSLNWNAITEIELVCNKWTTFIFCNECAWTDRVPRVFIKVILFTVADDH